MVAAAMVITEQEAAAAVGKVPVAVGVDMEGVGAEEVAAGNIRRLQLRPLLLQRRGTSAQPQRCPLRSSSSSSNKQNVREGVVAVQVAGDARSCRRATTSTSNNLRDRAAEAADVGPRML